MALILLSQSKLQSFLLKLILGWIYAFSFALFLKVIKRMHCKGCRCGLTWFDMEWLDMDMESEINPVLDSLAVLLLKNQLYLNYIYWSTFQYLARWCWSWNWSKTVLFFDIFWRILLSIRIVSFLRRKPRVRFPKEKIITLNFPQKYSAMRVGESYPRMLDDKFMSKLNQYK